MALGGGTHRPHSRLEGKLESLTEQVRVDHQQLLLALSAPYQTIQAALTNQQALMSQHFDTTQRRFGEVTETVREFVRESYGELTVEIEEIKHRLDRLENPPAA